MRVDVVCRPMAAAVWVNLFGCSRQQCDGIVDAGDDVADAQEHPRQQVHRGVGREAAVAAARRAGNGFFGLSHRLRGRADQRGEVVGQDLGGDISDERLLAQRPRGF
jgi:hypothetical protein